FLEGGRKHAEILLLPRFQPANLRTHCGSCQLSDEILGRRERVLALAPHLAQIGQLPLAQTLRVRFGSLEQPRDSRRGKNRMTVCLERGELLTAQRCASARQRHRTIPPQDRGGRTKRVQAPEFVLEVSIRSQRHER